ncbi:adenosylcobinamide-GDP ribazoletransferase [Brucella sp. BE17]|uniref:adenosylcobinamide-GDP ribazoletransferase n=1 Tax=Brucella sp. BE17 TaxID=3142977 RepID=UPI0031BBBB5E
MQQNGLIGDTIRSLGFLSRLPLPDKWLGRWNTHSHESWPPSTRAFPLAGGVLGFLGGVALFIANALHLPALACGFIAVGALAAMTGALHEDGLGDTVDGFFGASNRERRLDIMKDSRIGTFAAITLVVWVGIKASLLATILERLGPGHTVFVLIASEAASRAAMLALWHGLPSARPGGLADGIGQPEWETVVYGAGLGLVILAIGLWPAGGIAALIYSLALVSGLLFGFSKLCMVKIGGQTGDTLGAAQQIASLGVLVGLVMAL